MSKNNMNDDLDQIKNSRSLKESTIKVNEEHLNDSLDDNLYAVFENDNVPDNLNITLKNRLDHAASLSKRKIELWWMPAVINTVIALAGVVLSIVLYFMLRIGGSYTIIPNIINRISVLGFKMVIILACADMLLGWLSTAILIPLASGRGLTKGINIL